jgi:6-phosphogluconolactonase (cycloisomerase 2 family)
MEIKQRMSKRFAWLLGVGLLISIGVLVACGTNFNPSADGLIVVGSQGSGLLETYSFSLSSGHSSSISNPPADTSNQVCVLKGIPSSILIDPAGTYAYTIINGNSTCGNANINNIVSFKINSDGTIAQSGTLTPDPNPTALAMDSSGKFLFVVEGLNTVPPQGTPQPNQMPCPGTGTAPQRGVCVYAIGSGGALTPVLGTFNFNLPTGFQTPNFAALAVTPTVFPAIGVNGVQNAVCSTPGLPQPTTEFLYVADSVNNVVWQYQVNMSTGVLTNPPSQSQVRSFPAGTTPSGVAVDPCYRFVYVSDLQTNQISAFTICNGLPTQSAQHCPQTPDGSLVAVSGSPFSLTTGNGPGPIVVDPFGKFVYVLDTLSSQISTFQISPISGSITAGPIAATGLQPISIAIRGDDNWLFVTNFQSATLSQYSITPSNGALTPQPAIGTDNEPWGVAVK